MCSLREVSVMFHQFPRVVEVGVRAYVEPCAVYREECHPESAAYCPAYEVGGIDALARGYQAGSAARYYVNAGIGII